MGRFASSKRRAGNRCIRAEGTTTPWGTVWCHWLQSDGVCRAPCSAAHSSHEKNPTLTFALCPSQCWEATGLPNTSLQSILVSALTVPTRAKFDIGLTTIGFLQCLKIASNRFCKSRRLCVCVCCVSGPWQGCHHETLLPSRWCQSSSWNQQIVCSHSFLFYCKAQVNN